MWLGWDGGLKMAYTVTTWLDRVVSTPNKYTKSLESAGSVTLVADAGTVTQAGTPVNATNLNKIEQGISNVAITADATKAIVNIYAQQTLGGF